MNFMYFRLVLRQDKIHLYVLVLPCASLRLWVCKNWENKNGKLQHWLLLFKKKLCKIETILSNCAEILWENTTAKKNLINISHLGKQIMLPSNRGRTWNSSLSLSVCAWASWSSSVELPQPAEFCVLKHLKLILMVCLKSKWK